MGSSLFRREELISVSYCIEDTIEQPSNENNKDSR